MYSQLPMYQRIGKKAYKVDLSNTLKLSEFLGHPENGFKTVHVTGTNGKGSTCHMLASVLQKAGYRVGLYTSPHLIDFRERIKINGEMIAKRRVSSFITKNKPFFENNHLSFFEMTVGLAFDYFNKEKVDIAIIEVGLGGRLDSTNIITPEISVITNIGLDHTQFLGNTITEIAKEKAGIIKPNIPIVIGETLPETKKVFVNIAKQKQAPIFFSEEIVSTGIVSDLKGNYQKKNIKTTLCALQILIENGWKISQKNIEIGLQEVVKNTGLQGRWQILRKHPKIICDTAHNKEGLVETMKQLYDEKFKDLHIVLGVVNDKNLDTILPFFPKNARYYFCKPNVLRGLSATILKEKCEAYNLFGDVFISVKDALKNAKIKANPNDLIYIGGSTFVVAEIL